MLDIQIKTIKLEGTKENRIFTDKATGSHVGRDELRLWIVKVEDGEMGGLVVAILAAVARIEAKFKGVNWGESEL